MSEFGLKLQPPENPVATQPWEEFVSDSEDWEDDYASQVILACDFLELCGYTFAVHGFGKDAWPVTVGYDLSTILEEMPDQLEAIERGEPAKIDMYAPGTEVEIDVQPAGSDVELTCTAALWEPEPRSIMLGRADFLSMVRDMLADFAAALEDVGSSLSEMEPFHTWGQERR